jgi:hypothetical protein
MMQNFTLELFLETAPPRFSRLLGYRGSWRWVAFYWNSMSKGSCFPRHFDGHAYGPVNQAAWDAFFDHRLILAFNHRREDGYAIKRFEFGGERTSASHWLLLDRQERRLYAGSEAEVVKFIHIFMDQRPARKEVKRVQEPQQEEAGRRNENPQGAIRQIIEMTAWLDERLAMLEKAGKWPIFGD